MADHPVIAQDAMQERFSRAFRMFVGCGKPYSVEAVASSSGVPYATCRAYHEGRSTPGYANLLRLIAVLPPEFGGMLLQPTGYTLMPVDPGEAGSLVLNRHAAALISKIAADLEDGRIDHLEEAQQEPLVRTLQAACSAWLARRDQK